MRLKRRKPLGVKKITKEQKKTIRGGRGGPGDKPGADRPPVRPVAACPNEAEDPLQPHISSRVKVWVSTWEMPGTALRAARTSASGAKPLASHSPNLGSSSAVMILKSKHPPQTTRWTDWKPGSALSAGRLESSTPWAACSEALSSSADHLHRHSRATVANRTPAQISTGAARASPAPP